MLEVLRQEYVRTARAQGMPESRVIGRHALQNAMIPIITVVGLSFGVLLGGAVVFFGVDPRTGRRFVVQSIEGGGWGGRPFEDGEPATP